MNDLPFDPLQLMREPPEKMRIPGALLSKQGAQHYVGSVPAITGTLFFTDAHSPVVREAICACFDDYQLLAKQHLTWLWREEPADGQDKIAYANAKPMRATAFQEMFVNFARRLKAIHGYGGHGLVLSAVRDSDNQPFEAFLAEKLNGLDVGDPVGAAATAHQGIKTVSWLTAVSNEMVEKIGGREVLFSELPMDWFAIYDYEAGIVVQGGPKPEAAPVDAAPKPARLALPNLLFKDLRAPKMRLHNASKDGEPRMIGWAAEQWLKRFDVADDEIIGLKAKLLDEPKLTSEATLPGAINRP